MSKENSCSCNSCKTMCINSPCFPTPQDVLLLEENGYRDMLITTMWANIQDMSLNELVAPKGTVESNGISHRCIFLDDNQLCKLHSEGLKPKEGRLASHNMTPEDSHKLRQEICNSWKSDIGIRILKRFDRKLEVE